VAIVPHRRDSGHHLHLGVRSAGDRLPRRTPDLAPHRGLHHRLFLLLADLHRFERDDLLFPAQRERDQPLPATPEAWLAGAAEHPGSWWPTWAAWLKPQAGALVAAPKTPGSARYPAIEPAPGRYVKVKA
jgi:hypothetical protein